MRSIVFLIFLLLSCQSDKPARQVSDLEADSMAIHKVLHEQQEAWNRGSIDDFMKGYLNSKDLSFIGRSGVNKGWQTTLENYKKSYPDKEAMGQLNFDVIELTKIDEQSYLLLGQYTLLRAEDEPSGYFSLVWKKIDGSWKIISDHTSG